MSNPAFGHIPKVHPGFQPPQPRLPLGIRHQQGFTLLELIIVCLLITVSLAFTVPKLRQTMVVDQLAASSRKIIAMIKEVRNLAAQKQQPYVIHFDLDGKKIWYQPDAQKSTKERETEKPPPGFQLPPTVHLQDIQTGTAERKTAGDISLWINKQGYMDQTILHLVDDQDKVISLALSPFLSTIKVHDTYISLE